jgi:hypothetical protein
LPSSSAPQVNNPNAGPEPGSEDSLHVQDEFSSKNRFRVGWPRSFPGRIDLLFRTPRRPRRGRGRFPRHCHRKCSVLCQCQCDRRSSRGHVLHEGSNRSRHREHSHGAQSEAAIGQANWRGHVYRGWRKYGMVRPALHLWDERRRNGAIRGLPDG